jgi:HEAT repeat protein
LNDPKKGVRSAAAEALGKLADSRYVPVLESALGDDEHEVREATRLALRKLAEEPAFRSGQ